MTNGGRRAAGSIDSEAVARRAGVSTATVSRAMRGLPNVSEATRAKVLAAARELDYVVSPSASRLASGQTRTVAVVMPYVDRHYFANVLAGAEAVLRASGYDLLLYVLPDDAAREDFFARMPVRRRVDAVLVLTLPLKPAQVEQFLALDMPVAAVGMGFPGVAAVSIDDSAAARSAVDHLINLGHRRIAMIGGGVSEAEPNPFTTPEMRRAGYRAALTGAGIPLVPEYEVDGQYTSAGGEHAMAQLLSLPSSPTAVFAQSDRMAYGALHALRRMGLACPDDVSVIGIDDHETAEALDLTTVAQPMHAQGAEAARQLLDALSGEQPVDVLLPTHLVLRSTTAAPGSRVRG